MLLCAVPAGAAQPGDAPGQVGGTAGQTRDPLSRYLHDLADNPHSVAAMTGAGKAALEMGDAQAALTFFARAENEAPRDGRVKALMGGALVQLEQPRAAMKFFTDATTLGYPEADLAGDRGLAWDILGDPRRAQRDYRLALTRGPDEEVTRRLALSLGISGDREAALRLLEAQLRNGDRAAERTRALVLALTGDTAGAARAVEASMPGAAGQAMMPFLARLPQLGYADRALAVHLGHFPTDGRAGAPPPANAYASNAYASNDFAASVQRRPTEAGRPDPSAPSLARLVAAAPQQVDESPRRRPGETQAASAPPPKAAPVRQRVVQSATTESEWSWSRGGSFVTPRASPRPKPSQPASSTTGRSAALNPPPTKLAEATPPPATPRPQPQPQSAAPALIELPAGQSVSIARNDPPTAAAHAAPASPPASSPRSSSRLADLEAAVEEIAAPVRDEEVAPAVRTASLNPHRTEAAHAAPAKPAAAAEAKRKPEPKKPEPKPEPSRSWVQIAVAADRSELPGELARLKAKAPKLLTGHAGWTAPMGKTNRLLVGPFPTAKEAQVFLNDLGKANVGGFAWTSDEGEKVQKLPAK